MCVFFQLFCKSIHNITLGMHNKFWIFFKLCCFSSNANLKNVFEFENKSRRTVWVQQQQQNNNNSFLLLLALTSVIIVRTALFSWPKLMMIMMKIERCVDDGAFFTNTHTHKNIPHNRSQQQYHTWNILIWGFLAAGLIANCWLTIFAGSSRCSRSRRIAADCAVGPSWWSSRWLVSIARRLGSIHCDIKYTRTKNCALQQFSSWRSPRWCWSDNTLWWPRLVTLKCKAIRPNRELEHLSLLSSFTRSLSYTHIYAMEGFTQLSLSHKLRHQTPRRTANGGWGGTLLVEGGAHTLSLSG